MKILKNKIQVAASILNIDFVYLNKYLKYLKKNNIH